MTAPRIPAAVIATPAAAGLALIGWLLAGGGRPSAPVEPGLPAIGQVRSADGSVQIRHARALDWEPLEAGAALREGDQVRTSSGGRALLWLEPDRTLTLSGDSQVTLQQARRLRLERGAAEVGASEIEIDTGASRITAGRRRLLFVPGGGPLPPDAVGRLEAELTYVERWAEATGAAGERLTGLLQNARGLLGAGRSAEASGVLAAIAREWTLRQEGDGGVIAVTKEADGRERVFVLRGQADLRATLGSVALTEGSGLDVGRGRPLGAPIALLAAPRLVAPAHERAVYNLRRPELSWEPVEGAVAYVVELFRGTDSSRPLATLETQAPRLAPPGDLADGAYAWRVRALDAGRQPGMISRDGRFTVKEDRTPPALEILTRPRWEKGS